MNGFRSLIAEMRSEPSDARFEGSEVRNTVLYTSLHGTNPKSFYSRGIHPKACVHRSRKSG
ncbi:hypothetical protein RHMOL_Rhmol04G0379200 [Rhododendron molle]|nr:hypothetical protein RHMOL_Rhmol04G0379200 [Rhododendron molle]